MQIQKTYIKNLLTAFHEKDYDKVYKYLKFLSDKYHKCDLESLNDEIVQHNDCINSMIKAGYPAGHMFVIGMQDSMVELIKKRGELLKC